MRKEIEISRQFLDVINRFMTVEPAEESECLPEGMDIVYTASFDDGVEMEIRCCGVRFVEGISNLSWSEATLYKDNFEVAFSEPSNLFEGEWTLECDGETYTTVIKEKKNAA